MFPTIKIGFFLIPSYIVLVGLGFSIGSFLADKYAESFGLEKCNSFHLVLATEIGVIIGGKILYLLINIANLSSWFKKYGFMTFIKTGFVFYGGLIGAIVATFIFSKIKKINFSNSISLVLFLTPIVHGFGRIGCLLAGCCYGIEYNGLFSVTIKGINRFPVQLLESILNFLMFFIFYFLKKQKKNNFNVVPCYFIGYGIIRIITEHFRADIQRGFVAHISISFWISIILVITGILLIIIERRLFKKSNSI